VSYCLTSGYGQSCIFYTDCSLIEVCAGFAVHQMGVGGFGYNIWGPAGLLTAEFSALFTTLRHVTEVIRPPVRSGLCCLGTLHIRLTLYVNNCAGACARTEFR
jgi:hypothetical protein